MFQLSKLCIPVSSHTPVGFLEDSWRILGGFLEDSCRCLGLSGRFPLAVPERFSGDLTPLLPQSGRNADCFATNSTFDVAKG